MVGCHTLAVVVVDVTALVVANVLAEGVEADAGGLVEVVAVVAAAAAVVVAIVGVLASLMVVHWLHLDLMVLTYRVVALNYNLVVAEAALVAVAAAAVATVGDDKVPVALVL